MKTLKNKIAAITISMFFILSMAASTMLIPNASAHTPAWSIPTYAYIVAAPSPIGVGQSAHIYMWLDCVYGAAGGTTAAVGTNGFTASAALLSNTYRFHNYKLTITAPDNTVTTQTFPVITDTTSSQYTIFTPTQTGTYTFDFTFPGQVYGADGNGYSGSPLIGDTYLPSNASTTLIVQQTPISAPINSYPLPTAYWTHPVYGENTDWWSISSNWLGSGSAPPGGYSSSGSFSTLYHNDAVGPQTSHLMWTKDLQFGGVAGGNQFLAGGSNPNGAIPGAQYFEGSSYAPRFYNPIIINGVIFYTEVASFTGSPIMGGSATGPTDAVDLRTGQLLWSRMDVPQLSFGYIYNLYDPDQHGVYPPVLVATVGSQWNLYDAYTGDSLFNVTNVPSGTAVMGPSGEQLRYVALNTGTTANPQWYLSEWNMSKLWQYDINPYTGGGSLSPSIINATNGALIQQLPIPITGESGTLPPGHPTSASSACPYGSWLTVNANVPMNSNALLPGSTTTAIKNINQDSLTTYDWNISIPFANTMPVGPPSIFGPASPFTIVAANYNDILLCRNGSLPSGFEATGTGTSQGPYTYFAVNLNSSRGTVGSILWMKTYNPPAGNITLNAEPVDFQTRVFTFDYGETLQWVGYSLDTGNMLWGPTAPQKSFDYYGYPGTVSLPATIAYGHLYCSSFSGICYAYNDLTGHVDWTWGNGAPGSDNSTYGGLQIFYGDYPTMIQSIANGVIYLATNEHTIPNPIYKGAVATALNATTGKLIWQLSDYPSEWSSPGSEWATADGYIACINGYSSQIYSIGRGPSATTAEVEPFGASVVISGTVMDVSSGTKQNQQAADFPNGVPCSSDASMKDWMGYVYQQKPVPTNFTGVPVNVYVLDSNHNYRQIGTATTDATGTYSLTWTPDISGNFTVTATFAGTNGYWPSSAETHFYAVPAAPTVAPTATPLSGVATQNTLMYGIIAIIIVIIIIGALIMLMLSRRKP
ncbi:MAG: hypothetical protein ABSF44_04230 [Candidatus Bathyarchaeia archaeon]